MSRTKQALPFTRRRVSAGGSLIAVQHTRAQASENRNVSTMFYTGQIGMRFVGTGFINDLRKNAPQLAWDVAPVSLASLLTSPAVSHATANASDDEDGDEELDEEDGGREGGRGSSSINVRLQLGAERTVRVTLRGAPPVRAALTRSPTLRPFVKAAIDGERVALTFTMPADAIPGDEARGVLRSTDAYAGGCGSGTAVPNQRAGHPRQ